MSESGLVEKLLLMRRLENRKKIYRGQLASTRFPKIVGRGLGGS
jgi:hypothetical protein